MPPNDNLSPLETALIGEMRRSNDQMLFEFRRMVDHMTRDKHTDPTLQARRAEVNSWPMRLRLTLVALGRGIWTNFQQPIATAVTAIILYYAWQLSGQTPTPTPLQVESTPAHATVP